MRLRGRRSLVLSVVILLALAPAGLGQAAKAPSGGDGEWPRKIQQGEFTISVDAPQADSLDGTRLKARSTIRVAKEGAEPLVGTAFYDAEVRVDRSSRTVTLVSVQVPKVDLPGAPPARQQRLAARIGQAATRMQWRLSLDDVLASRRLAALKGGPAPKLNTEPPKILVVKEPAILVLFDGEPRFKAVDGSRLERALNTPFLVLRDPSANAYYLSGGTMWFTAPDPKGPWTKTEKPPSDALKIAASDLKSGGVSDSEVKQAAQSADKRVPKILVATEPTELIVADGEPQWTPVVEGQLESMGNSESDVFRTVPQEEYYLVLSGRWYKSASLDGPWSFVAPDRLPPAFHKIPADSAKADVLPFVPGTGPAREALADADTPRTAAVRRKDAHATATYDGDPKFEAIPGTQVEYAVNTPDQVLRIRGSYYLCDQGVWFSASSATGPWTVADKIPEDDIESIPADVPVYNTRYAYVYDSSPDLVYVAYTPAYLGSYPYYGAVVFGTGWYYRPWWGGFYYPRPWTWGFHPRYALWAGGWGYGFGWGPAWAGFRYGFGYGWGARWCGPGAFYRPAFRNVNITRNVNVTRNVSVTRNVYNSGANVNRAASTSHTVTARTSAVSRTGSPAHTAAASHSTSVSPRTSNPQAKGGKSAGAKPKASGKAAHGGGGKKK